MKDSMKVMFVYHNRVEDGRIPQSIAILGGLMKENGIEAKVFDTTFYRDKDSPFVQTDREDRENQAKGGYVKIEGFDQTREVVDLKAKFYEEVEKYRPDLIAATSTSFEFNSLTNLILPAKQEFGVPVIIGGSHATAAPYATIQNPAIDYVCRGEGERPLLELVKRLENKQDTLTVPNLVTKSLEGKIITNPRYSLFATLDQTPEADWSLFDTRHLTRPFEGELKTYGFFEMSRGCPHACSYCLNNVLKQMDADAPGDVKPGRYRFFSPEEIIGRMVKKKEEYGYDHVQLIDENMAALPTKKLEELAEMYKEKIGVGFFTQSRPEPFVGNSKKAKIMAEMGCKMIGMGMESGNAELRKTVLNRPMRDGVVEEAVENLKKEGIMTAAYYIIGFPGETEEMIQETIDLHRRVKPERFSVRFLYPFPGTEIRDLCIEKGFFDEDQESSKLDASYFREPVLNLPSPPHPTKERLIELKKEFEDY
jgi:anaerobic magnesium-protoporphyrin IX monomethyl ester cyclase